MPQWAGSCWYYIRYLDPHNDHVIADKKLLDHWLPVDLYIGGQEHAVLHLLYARFWHKFLYDLGVVSSPEPFKKLFHQGMILGSNGEKMSKSAGNVVNPDEVIDEVGADALRLFEMFLGPLHDDKPWDTKGLNGARRFLERVYRLFTEKENTERITDKNSGELDYSYNFLVKKVTNEFESLDFNTAISQFMVFVNDCYKAKTLYKPYLEGFIKMLSCVTPFIGEEIWSILGHKGTIAYEPWPTYDESKLVVNDVTIAVSINGKVRSTLTVNKDEKQDVIETKAKEIEKIKPYLENKTIRKVIYVPGKIINFIVA